MCNTNVWWDGFDLSGDWVCVTRRNPHTCLFFPSRHSTTQKRKRLRNRIDPKTSRQSFPSQKRHVNLFHQSFLRTQTFYIKSSTQMSTLVNTIILFLCPHCHVSEKCKHVKQYRDYFLRATKSSTHISTLVNTITIIFCVTQKV